MEKSKQILGLDLGNRHIGVALLNLESKVAIPLSAIPNNRQLYKTLEQLVKEYRIDKIVAGLPLTLTGSESPQTGLARVLAQKISDHLQIAVELQDERLTSRQATNMLQGEHNHPPHHQDSVAAQLILESWLNQQ